MEPSTVIYLVIMLVCIIFSGYFSATETAFSTLNKTRIKMLAEKGDRRAKLVIKLSEDYNSLISSILIGNNIVNIALSSIGTVLFIGLLGDIGATVSTAVITVVVLIFGEISPKTLAKDFPEAFALFSAPIMRVVIWILTPFNFLFSLWKKLLSKLFKPKEEAKMSQEELLILVDEVQQDGAIDREEGSLLRNAIEFSDQTAEEILTHRVDLVAISADADTKTIARAFAESKFSRLPVYEEDIDHIIGILHQKDFYCETGVRRKPVRELMTPALFIPQTEKTSDLLKLFQAEQTHLAVVVDEYGGTVGIVTMEDILEELVGEIWDEHDEVVEYFTELAPDRFRVSYDVGLPEFCEFFHVKIESESSTLNGWIAENLNKIAEVGDRFTYENLTVVVTETNSLRAEFVEITVADPIAEEEKTVPAVQ